MLVIGILGPKRSGKEEIANHIKRKFGGESFAHSDVLNDILKVLQIPNTRMNLIKLVGLREVFDDDVLITALNKRIQERNKEISVVTGIRFQNELDNIKSYENNITLFVDSPIEARYERQMKRAQYADDHKMTFEEFVRIENEEVTENNISELGKQAEYKIQNDGTLNELYAKIDDIISKHIEK